MNKFFALKRKKERELLQAAQPIAKIFLEINSLQKEIEKKEKQAKNKRAPAGEIEKLKSELKKKKKELEKMDKEKVNKGKKAIRFLLYYNQNLVKYVVKGYSFLKGKVDHEELTSEGILSLLKAIEKFDLNSKYALATYAGFWIKQYIQSCINKQQFINQGTGGKEKKNVIYYDNNYQNDDKEGKSYSLLETLHDDENAELTAEQIRHQDAIIQTNNLINSLENRETILLIRLLHKIKPSNLLDIYYLTTEEERKELKKSLKLTNKSNLELLQKYSLEEQKIHSLPLVKKYLSLFTKSYKFSEVSKILGKSESAVRRLRQGSFQKLRKLAKERKLHFLMA